MLHFTHQKHRDFRGKKLAACPVMNFTFKRVALGGLQCGELELGIRGGREAKEFAT